MSDIANDPDGHSSVLSLFCGPGGLDLGFEQAGFHVCLAVDCSAQSVQTHNHNRPDAKPAVIGDLSTATLESLDQLAGRRLKPFGVIGGPPCQSFSRSNRRQQADDPRHLLPFAYARIIRQLNSRSGLAFFAFENVVELARPPYEDSFKKLLRKFDEAGFNVSFTTLNAADFGVAQNRRRLFIVGLNRRMFPGIRWNPPSGLETAEYRTVRDVLGGLPEPTFFRRGLAPEDIPYHTNHWCMQPKSKRFRTPGALRTGDSSRRSFKVLGWDRQSPTVAYGNREVHIHPNCTRRLSVFEAMLLQGFPEGYELTGTLSSQINQVSEAVPPPLAKAIAESIQALLQSLPDGTTTQPLTA